MRFCKDVIKTILKYIIKIIFFMMKILPIKENMIVLDSWKGKSLRGNILCIYKELLKDNKFEIILIGDNLDIDRSDKVRLCRSKSIKHIYYLAISKYWIVDTIYYDIFKPRKETIYILIWHAAGMFKRFGISSVNKSKELMEIYKRNGERLSYIVVSSEKIRDIYSKELCVIVDKVISLGLPRTDEFVKYESDIKEKIYSKYNVNNTKKLILYAPTFRGEGYTQFSLDLQAEVIKENLSDEYVILLKLHPNNYINNGKILNEFRGKVIVSEDDKIEDLMKASDLLITDYSSTLFEYSLLEKPMLFYAYDLKQYISKERSFYIEYKSFVPGPISYSTEELVKNIKDYCIDDYIESIKNIADNYQRHDGKCTQRFIEYFFNDK